MDANEAPPRAALSEVEIAARFRENYPHFQSAPVKFLAAHLADVSRVFQGDVQQPLILAVLGQRRLHWRADAKRLGGADPGWSPATAASRIVDVTGVPPETVRRKLKFLAARGWIERCRRPVATDGSQRRRPGARRSGGTRPTQHALGRATDFGPAVAPATGRGVVAAAAAAGDGVDWLRAPPGVVGYAALAEAGAAR